MIEVERLVAGEAILNEAVTVPRSQESSQDALEDLVRQHSRLVYRIAYAALRSHQDAEDATQETFLRVLRYKHKLANVENHKTWLARIAWRVAVERSKRHGSRLEIPLEDPEKPIPELPSLEASADEALHRSQVGAQLERLISPAEEIARAADLIGGGRDVSARRGRNLRNKRGRREVTRVQGTAGFEREAGITDRSRSEVRHMRNHKDESGVGSGQVSNRDALDRALDAALAKYVAAPRAGIEERVLANLRAERDRVEIGFGWRWPGIAAFAALAFVLGISVVWRSAKPAHDAAVHRSPATMANDPEPEAYAASRVGGMVPSHPAEPGRRIKTSHVAITADSVPKLDKFPSPQPLSEQEKILQSYVVQYPEHAALIAEARMEELRRDASEERGNTILGVKDSTR